ncbi:uncharacterized protein LOC115876099 [Sitophilus oryzae]|uniref:Uncharacterized protein LOC115876099 n=1 Tax=Sitophilus oryzae TaxID=7048 RepID=A0A6J2X9M2_SITOR|nr:uncharacterized protein LOC115876099 [Sitophilus oryzae]
MYTRRALLFGSTLIYILSFSVGTPWLYKAPGAILGLASSASSSASAAATPLSHIIDLRRKEEKSAQLQEDKQLSGSGEIDDNKEEVEASGDGIDKDENEEANEASPSFITKKVNKILAKLRLIAQIKNVYHYNKDIRENNFKPNLTFNITPVQSTTENDLKKEVLNTTDLKIEPVKEKSQKIQQVTPYFYKPPKTSIVFPKENLYEPTKIDIDVNAVNDKLQETKELNEKIQEPEPGRFGPVGVFFAELLGTVVGLTYGAIAQFTSGTQSPIEASTMIVT